MSWLRLDDTFDSHPKLYDLTESQRWRWTRLLLHCARHRTEGFVSRSTLRELGLTRAVGTLTTVGLLDSDPDGFRVHDWHDFNPKDPTKAQRQARWRAKQASPVDAGVDGDVDGGDGDSGDAPVDAETVHSRVGTRARPVPSPTQTPKEQTQGRTRNETTRAHNRDTNGNGPGTQEIQDLITQVDDSLIPF